MQTAPENFLARLERAARTAEREERDYRENYFERLKLLERARVLANRRADLLGKITRVVAAIDEDAQAHIVVMRVLCEEIGLLQDNEGHRIILERFSDVTDAIVVTCKEEVVDADSDPFEVMRDFEKWYRARDGGEFLALVDVYTPETPRVDF